MGTVAEVNLKMDHRASQASKVGLGTPVILRQILEQFSNEDLLKISLVNKQWNYEARCVLRDRGTLTAIIGLNSPTCQALGTLESHLKTMRVAPFSGIEVHLANNHVCQSILNGSLDRAYKVILDRLPWKKFSLKFCYDWEQLRDCPARTLVKNILHDFSGVLEMLSLTFDWQPSESVEHFFTNRSFPRLKTLNLKVHCIERDCTKFLKSLVAQAPNLKELQIVGSIEYFDESVLEGSSAVLVPCSDFNPLHERVCENLLGILRPKTIEIYRLKSWPLKENILNNYVPAVLQASLTTLETLRMDLLFAVPLMCYGICLENVAKLEIRMDSTGEGNVGSSILTLLKGFDFNRVFPNLNQVEIECDSMLTLSSEQIGAFVERGNAVLNEHLLGRAVSMKPLALSGRIFGSALTFLAKIFPDVKKLSVEKGDYTYETPFTSLWEQFENLVELNVIVTTRPNGITNLDSVFCEIFPEEVAELREKDDEFLKNVNIVPVMPSIVCMKELRAFKFSYTQESRKTWVTDPSFIFSKVTGLIGFARCPALAVTFQINSAYNSAAPAA